jgi:hypothetical protein
MFNIFKTSLNFLRVLCGEKMFLQWTHIDAGKILRGATKYIETELFIH